MSPVIEARRSRVVAAVAGRRELRPDLAYELELSEELRGRHDRAAPGRISA